MIFLPSYRKSEKNGLDLFDYELNKFTKQKNKMEKRLLTVKETSVYLGVQEGTLYHWVSSRSIPFAVKVGGSLRFDSAKMEKWLDENRIRMSSDEKTPKGVRENFIR